MVVLGLFDMGFVGDCCYWYCSGRGWWSGQRVDVWAEEWITNLIGWWFWSCLRRDLLEIGVVSGVVVLVFRIQSILMWVWCCLIWVCWRLVLFGRVCLEVFWRRFMSYGLTALRNVGWCCERMLVLVKAIWKSLRRDFLEDGLCGVGSRLLRNMC